MSEETKAFIDKLADGDNTGAGEAFKDALRVINQKKLGIVVILKNNFIIGIVTDGDLRRELKNYSNKNQTLENL